VKNILFFCTLILFYLGAAGGLYAQSGGKILISYFTLPVTSETDRVDANSGASIMVADGKTVGQVQFVADLIRKHTGGNIFAIQTVQSYPRAINPLLEFAKNEQDKNARPRLAVRLENLEQYDTIFLGYPIWWYDLPMPVYSFLEQYDLSGKTIIPFTVHGGSRFSGTIERITQQEPRANVSQDGLAISRNSVARSERDIIAWLRRLGMVK
jgi:flavodoxin